MVISLAFFFCCSRRKLSTKSKKWKSIFNLGRSGSESKSKLSRNGSVFVRAQKLSGKNTLFSYIFLSRISPGALIALVTCIHVTLMPLDLRQFNGIVFFLVSWTSYFHVMARSTLKDVMPGSYSKYSILVCDKQAPTAQLSSLGTRKCYVAYWVGLVHSSNPANSLHSFHSTG